MSRYYIKNHELKNAIEAYMKKAVKIVFPHFVKLEYNASLAMIVLLHKLDREIFSITEYCEMKKIIYSDEKISNHFDKLVGSWYGQSRLELKSILRTMIQSLCFGQKDRGFNKKLFNTLYRDFEAFFYNDEIEMIVIVPISNLRLSSLPIKLGNLTIRRIKEEEKQHFEEDKFGLRSVDYHLTNHVIEYQYSTKKIIRNDDEINKNSIPHEQNPFEEITKLISALRIFHTGGFDYNISITKGAGTLQFFGTSTSQLSKPRIFSREYFLDNKKIKEFVMFWEKFYKTNYLNFKPNGIATRRYSSSFEKTNHEDILIDMLIAFEALFFKQGESGEITHKISVRVSKFLEKDFELRQELFKQVKQIYHIRSAIVHGDSPSFDKTDFKDIFEINNKITHLLRESLKKFIEENIDSREKHNQLITKLDLQ